MIDLFIYLDDIRQYKLDSPIIIVDNNSTNTIMIAWDSSIRKYINNNIIIHLLTYKFNLIYFFIEIY